MEYLNRKHPRLKNYDYSLPGYYYVTIHIERGVPELSRIRLISDTEGAEVLLSEYGQIALRQLIALEKRYTNVKIDKYVIMPTHIHAIIRLLEPVAGASPRPTLPEVVGVFKSLTTRECNRYFCTPGRKLFQSSFFEKVLRNERMYQACWLYIDGNPARWHLEPEDI